MSTDISRWLKEVAEIQGVAGVFVLSNRGQIVAHTRNTIDNQKIENMARRMLIIAGAWDKKNKPLKEIEMIAQNYRVLCMMRENFTVMTFCHSMEALPLIRMTLNVVMAHLFEDKKFMKFISKSSVRKFQVLDREQFDAEETILISKLQ